MGQERKTGRGSKHLHPRIGNKAHKSRFGGQCFPGWAYVVEAVPPSPGEFAGSSVVGCSMRKSGAGIGYMMSMEAHGATV